METTKILDISLDFASKEECLDVVSSYLAGVGKKYVVTPNPEMLVLAYSDEYFKKVLNLANLRIPDGVGLEIVAKLLKQAGNVKRVPGRKLFSDLLNLANEKKLRVYFLGSSKDVVEKLIKKVNTDYAGVKVKGNPGPQVDASGEPISQVNIKSHKDILSDINKFEPDMLFVAFGAPKQEKWIAKNISKLNVKVAMGVGGTFDYFAGVKKLPPKWMETSGLEWLWRLLHEKGHLRRVFRALVIFPLLVLKERLNDL